MGLDLGAVAKGLAIDMAAHVLQPYAHFMIDAGGDLFVSACRPDGQAWSVGIRDARGSDGLAATIQVGDRAVCTSGAYARRDSANPDVHHILDPRVGTSPLQVMSVTVVAPTAMLADAVSTAAFVLGAAEGLRLFERLGVDGLVVTASLEFVATPGMYSDYRLLSDPAAHSASPAAILPHV